MFALTLEARGEAEDLRMNTLPTPAPAAGEVLIGVEACGLNPSDFQRARYGVPEWDWPAVLGLDVAGTVQEVGASVTRFRVGDRVAGHLDIRQRGGFAEYTVAAEEALAHIPDEITFESAAALPSAGLTAYQAVVRRLRVEADDTVLLTGGAGGVGGFAVQLAAHVGARVIATDSGDREQHVRALGAHEFIDFRTEDIRARVLELTGGRGVDAVLDTVNSDSATQNIGLLAFGGRIATTAGRPDLETVPPFSVGPSVHEIALGAAYARGDARARRDLGVMLEELSTLVRDGAVSPMISEVVPLSAVPTRLMAMSLREVQGKVVYSRSA